jgi:ribosomal protein L40E
MKNSVKRLAKRAKINKKCNPHLFRHSRATFLADHLTEFQMDQYLGWIQGSKMPSTYIHMSDWQLDNSILALNGTKIEREKKESILKPIKCPRCTTLNPPDAKFCTKCAGALTVNAALELEDKISKEKAVREKYDNIMNKLLEDPEVLDIIKKKLSGMQA